MRVAAVCLFLVTFAVTRWALRVPESTDVPLSPVVLPARADEPTRPAETGAAPTPPAAETRPRIYLPDGVKAMSIRAAVMADEIPYGPKPGTKVDVLRLPGGRIPVGPPELVVSGLVVLARSFNNTVDEKTGYAIPQVDSPSLAVTDEQARLLTLADERGRLLIVHAK